MGGMDLCPFRGPGDGGAVEKPRHRPHGPEYPGHRAGVGGNKYIHIEKNNAGLRLSPHVLKGFRVGDHTEGGQRGKAALGKAHVYRQRA